MLKNLKDLVVDFVLSSFVVVSMSGIVLLFMSAYGIYFIPA